MKFIIGDIHGKFDPLLKLSKLIKDYVRNFDEPHTVIFLGDYIDRGGEEKEVIEYLDSLPFNGFEHVFLRGNHEDMFLESLNTRASPYIDIWLNNGGKSTLKSYNITTEQFLKKQVPNDLVFFITRTKMFHRVGKFFIVHAGINPNVHLGNQKNSTMLWIREEFLRWDYPFKDDIFVIHGHTPVTYDPKFIGGDIYPVQTQNRLNLDTGSVWTNILSCAVIDNTGENLIDILTTNGK